MPAVRKTQEPSAQGGSSGPRRHRADRVQRRYGEGEVDRKTDINRDRAGRVDDEADILQHGVEIAPLQRPRELAVKRAGEDQGMRPNSPTISPMMANTRLDQRSTRLEQRATKAPHSPSAKTKKSMEPSWPPTPPPA